MWKHVVIFGLVAATSCKREPPAPSVALSASVVVEAAAPSASVATVDVDPNVAPMEVAKKWNDAINAKDLAALGALHDASVRFYGLTVDNATYVAKMKAALAKDPSFHQDIASMRVDWPHTAKAKVSFRKKDNKAEHAAYLVMDRVGGNWKIVEESDLVTDANLKCVNSADATTLTGTIEEGSFMWHDQITSTTVFVLSTPICVIRSGDDYWGDGGNERMDGVDSVTLEAVKPELSSGTKVRATLNHFQPHIGSGHYSTALMAFATSTTPLP